MRRAIAFSTAASVRTRRRAISAFEQPSAALKRRAPQEWDLVDVEIDAVLHELRSASPQADREKEALDTLLHEFVAPAGA